MTKAVSTTAKAKKHQVFVGTELKTESNKPEEALQTVMELQKENVSEIVLVNHSTETTNIYTKGRYDKNYRITAGEYKKTSLAVTTEEAPAE